MTSIYATSISKFETSQHRTAPQASDCRSVINASCKPHVGALELPEGVGKGGSRQCDRLVFALYGISEEKKRQAYPYW